MEGLETCIKIFNLKQRPSRPGICASFKSTRANKIYNIAFEKKNIFLFYIIID